MRLIEAGRESLPLGVRAFNEYFVIQFLHSCFACSVVSEVDELNTNLLPGNLRFQLEKFSDEVFDRSLGVAFGLPDPICKDI